jgi:hypothetical protein
VGQHDPITPRFSLSTDEKVALFRRLFRGRADVYPVRWESKSSGKAGYAQGCADEWRAGVCEKPRVKCGDCGQRLLISLSDAVIYGHLAGEHTVGVYPLLGMTAAIFWRSIFMKPNGSKRPISDIRNLELPAPKQAVVSVREPPCSAGGVGTE